MTDFDFVPGKPKIGSLVSGVPYSPAGPEFGDWLNDILGRGAATHWTTLSSNFTATIDHHGEAFRLGGFTLALNPAVDLQKGWRAIVVGPGTIDPQDGPTHIIVANEWAILGSDGTSTYVLRSGSGGSFNIVPRGEWDVDAVYEEMDAVFKAAAGASYLSLQEPNEGNDPEDETPGGPYVWWMPLAVSAPPALDNDPTLAANSTVVAPTQSAVKAYADQLIAAADAMVFKGTIDASANPNYPAADRGWTYRISVAGKIGGASGAAVEVGDQVMCIVDSTAAGDQATVGANWNIVQSNLDGVVFGPSSSAADNLPTFGGSTGKVIQDSGVALTAIARKTDLLVDKTEDVKTADFSIGAADARKLFVVNSASPVAVTLAVAATLGAGFTCVVENIGAGTVTLSITGGAAFDTAETSIDLPFKSSLLIWSNGSVIRPLLRGGGGGGSSTIGQSARINSIFN